MTGAAPFRAALVHDWLTGMRGGEKVLESLAELLPGAPIYTLFHFRDSLSKGLERRDIKTTWLQHMPMLRRYYRYYLPLYPGAIESHRLRDLDLVVSSSHCVAKGIIPPPGARHLCYCHTPMRYAWDQRDAYFPKQSGPWALLRWELDRLARWDQATAHRVDRFVANSSFVAERIRKYYDRGAAVVPPPVDTRFFTPGEGPRGDYCLVVSALSPYKRVDIAVAACARLGRELRVVGTGPEAERLARRAGAADVRLLGRVGAEDLRDLYRGAACLLQPQIEDFGIAAVEALACGCPVVARGEGGVRDIVEDGRHGVLYAVAEGDDEAGLLASAVERLGGQPFPPAALRQRAESFSERRFRDSMRAQIDELMAGGGQEG